MFRAAHRSSSGALTVFAASGLHTLKITENQLLNYNDKYKTKQIITILKTILAQNYFTFHDAIYQPNKVVAMGSPISGTRGEIFLHFIHMRM
jgi:hypothetical protein